MTESRTKITLDWRPTTAPAPRVDDFVDQPLLAPATTIAVQPESAQPQWETEADDLGYRLEAWGMWTAPTGGASTSGLTSSIYDRKHRIAGREHAGADTHERISHRDVVRINSAFARLAEDHRKLLYWTYVVGPVGLSSRTIARECGFPKNEYNARLAAAHTAIECLLDEIAEKRP